MIYTCQMLTLEHLRKMECISENNRFNLVVARLSRWNVALCQGGIPVKNDWIKWKHFKLLLYLSTTKQDFMQGIVEHEA